MKTFQRTVAMSSKPITDDEQERKRIRTSLDRILAWAGMMNPELDLAVTGDISGCLRPN
jgi:hypothetical protein